MAGKSAPIVLALVLALTLLISTLGPVDAQTSTPESMVLPGGSSDSLRPLVVYYAWLDYVHIQEGWPENVIDPVWLLTMYDEDWATEACALFAVAEPMPSGSMYLMTYIRQYGETLALNVTAKTYPPTGGEEIDNAWLTANIVEETSGWLISLVELEADPQNGSLLEICFDRHPLEEWSQLFLGSIIVADSEGMSPLMPTPTATVSGTITTTPYATGTPINTFTPSPTPLPYATWTPSPSPTAWASPASTLAAWQYTPEATFTPFATPTVYPALPTWESWPTVAFPTRVTRTPFPTLIAEELTTTPVATATPYTMTVDTGQMFDDIETLDTSINFMQVYTVAYNLSGSIADPVRAMRGTVRAYMPSIAPVIDVTLLAAFVVIVVYAWQALMALVRFVIRIVEVIMEFIPL